MTAACQASLSFTISHSLLKFMSTESVMPSNHFVLCRPLLLLPSIFPSIRVFSNESVITSGDQGLGASASASVLPMNIQGLFSLGLAGLISLLSKGHSRIFYFIIIKCKLKLWDTIFYLLDETKVEVLVGILVSVDLESTVIHRWWNGELVKLHCREQFVSVYKNVKVSPLRNYLTNILEVKWSHSVVSDSLQPHGL